MAIVPASLPRAIDQRARAQKQSVRVEFGPCCGWWRNPCRTSVQTPKIRLPKVKIPTIACHRPKVVKYQQKRVSSGLLGGANGFRPSVRTPFRRWGPSSPWPGPRLLHRRVPIGGCPSPWRLGNADSAGYVWLTFVSDSTRAPQPLLLLKQVSGC